MLAIMALWTALGLPQVASQGYVDGKFQTVSDVAAQTRGLVINTQVQINRLSIQQLKSRQFQLEEANRVNPSLENRQRLLEIQSDLQDAEAERRRLLSQPR